MGGRGSLSGLSGGGYTSFNDALDGNRPIFAGDGSRQAAFFDANSNYNELIDDMDWQHEAAFVDWSNGVWMGGQQYKGWSGMSPEERATTKMFDDVLDQATLSKGVVLSRRADAQLVLGRGNRSASLEELKSMEGSIVSSKANMSFSAASQGIPMGTSGSVEYKLSIPGGTKGAGMYIGTSRINEWGSSQREFMMNRDISFRVGKVTHDSRRNIHIVNLQYVGRQAHDYGS